LRLCSISPASLNQRGGSGPPLASFRGTTSRGLNSAKVEYRTFADRVLLLFESAGLPRLDCHLHGRDADPVVFSWCSVRWFSLPDSAWKPVVPGSEWVNSIALLRQARQRILRSFDTIVVGVGGRAVVVTDRDRYEAGRVIFAAGAWISDLVPALGTKAIPECQILGWFLPRKPELFTPDVFPVSDIQTEFGHFYQSRPGTSRASRSGAITTSTRPDTRTRFRENRRPPTRRCCARRSGTCFRMPTDAPAGRVPVHEHAQRALRHRRPSGCARNRGRVSVLGSWLQVRQRDRRGAGGARYRGREQTRPLAVRYQPVRRRFQHPIVRRRSRVRSSTNRGCCKRHWCGSPKLMSAQH
jgi:hypothetical protein